MGSCTIQRDEYEVDEDAGGKDNREKDATGMMASFVTLLAWLSRATEGSLYNTTRRIRGR